MKNKLTNRKIFLVEAVKVKHSKTQVEFVLKKNKKRTQKTWRTIPNSLF